LEWPTRTYGPPTGRRVTLSRARHDHGHLLPFITANSSGADPSPETSNRLVFEICASPYVRVLFIFFLSPLSQAPTRLSSCRRAPSFPHVSLHTAPSPLSTPAFSPFFFLADVARAAINCSRQCLRSSLAVIWALPKPSFAFLFIFLTLGLLSWPNTLNPYHP
jgi:hypothetical protein